MPTDHPTAKLSEKHWNYDAYTVFARDSTVDPNNPDPDHVTLYDQYVTMAQPDGSAGVNNNFGCIISWYENLATGPWSASQYQSDPGAFPDPTKDAGARWLWPDQHHVQALGNNSTTASHYQPTPDQMAALGFFTDNYNDLSWHGPAVAPAAHPQTFQIPPPLPANKVAEHCFVTGNEVDYFPEVTYYGKSPLVNLAFTFDADDLPSNAINIRWKITVTGVNTQSQSYILGGQTTISDVDNLTVHTMEWRAASDTYRNNTVWCQVQAYDLGGYYGGAFNGYTTSGEFTVATIVAERTWDLAGGSTAVPQELEIHLDTYEARTGLSTHPGTATDTSGWSIYAAMCDVISRPVGAAPSPDDFLIRDVALIIAAPPSDLNSPPGTIVCDIAMNSATLRGFLNVPVGGLLGDTLGEDWDLGRDQNLGVQMALLPNGVYANVIVYPRNLFPAVARNYYVDLAQANDNDSGQYSVDGSNALGHFTGKDGIGDVLIDDYFLLAAQIRIANGPDDEDTFPNFVGTHVVAETTFYLGTPLSLKLTAKDLGSTYNFS